MISESLQSVTYEFWSRSAGQQHCAAWPPRNASTPQVAARVLLVDDDVIVRSCLGAAMAAEGYEVHTAPDASAALASMQQHFSSIVILDVNMPGMNGLDLCRTIRRQTFPGYVYVMLHTTKGDESDIIAGFEAGADDYLCKSASQSQLVARLRTARRVLTLERSLKSAVGERELMAMTDMLTRAFNRRYLLQHLSRELSRAHRLDTELSVLVLDFDHFSDVNDRYGHAAGDVVLIELVKRIQHGLRRDCDWCARLGGDEFVIVLPQTGLAGAGVVAESLRRAIEAAPMATGTGIMYVTASIGASGLSVVDDRGSATAEMLIELADRSLYESKNSGRNRATIPQSIGRRP